MGKRIRLFGRRTRSSDEEFTSIGVYVKTRNLIREEARKEKVPIYLHVHNLVMLSKQKPKGGSNGRIKI